MYILDSSVYVSAFLEEDSKHIDWINILSNINTKIFIPYLIFQEVITVLTYKHSKKLAEAFTDYILKDKRFIITNQDIMEEIWFWKEIDKNLSYIDIVVIYIAIKYSLKIKTFDKEMDKLYLKINWNLV